MKEKHKLWKIISHVVEDIRPFIQQDGGDIQLTNITDDNIVSIQFLGACIGCGLLDDYTLQAIESIIKDEVPEIKKVIVATSEKSS